MIAAAGVWTKSKDGGLTSNSLVTYFSQASSFGTPLTEFQASLNRIEDGLDYGEQHQQV